MVKCALCKNKIHSLMVSVHTCRCKNIYCHMHMHNHSCTFDYGLDWKKNAEKTMPKVEKEKVSKL
uniref:AN1-type domain-containing protein n=1 Tax=viral metagenome TaxID=1070528 RepID=A0A6C0H3C5_9ZZZZ